MIAGFRVRQSLQIRGGDLSILDGGIHFFRIVDQGEQVGVGEQFQQGHQDLLPAPHPGHPIMDNGDPQGDLF